MASSATSKLLAVAVIMIFIWFALFGISRDAAEFFRARSQLRLSSVCTSYGGAAQRSIRSTWIMASRASPSLLAVAVTMILIWFGRRGISRDAAEICKACGRLRLSSVSTSYGGAAQRFIRSTSIMASRARSSLLAVAVIVIFIWFALFGISRDAAECFRGCSQLRLSSLSTSYGRAAQRFIRSTWIMVSRARSSLPAVAVMTIFIRVGLFGISRGVAVQIFKAYNQLRLSSVSTSYGGAAQRFIRSTSIVASRARSSILAVAVIVIFIWLGLFGISTVAAENGQFSFVANASTAARQTEYDYIIVGGGTAGCPLAATLSQNYSVLLLERGGAPYDNLAVQNAVNFALVLTDLGDATISAAQGFQSEEGVINRRARILGGGSVINAGFYSHAEPSWISDRELDIARVNDSYQWVEKVVANFPTLGPWQRAVRNGLLEAGVRPDNGVTYEHLTGTKTGGTIFDSVGHRHSAADLLQYANPENIRVLTYATADQITFSLDDSGNSVPKATGIIFSDELGQQHQAVISEKPGSEVILSSGALGSPQLLLLSGIGPAAHLKEFGIPVVLDQPAVGQQMCDNPAVSMLIPSREAVENSLVTTAGILPAGGFYIESGSGATTSFGEMGTLNTLSPDYRNQDTVDSFTRLIPTFPRESLSVIAQAGVIVGKLATPMSRGYLKLNSTDVRENPLVRFNYFTEIQDLYSCVEGVRVMQNVVKSTALASILYRRLPDLALTWAGYVGPLAPETDDAGLLSQWCRETVMTIWHFHGGCQEGVVVDKSYKLLGIDALRVIDGSTFNSSPGTNPQATVMMLGRYMGLKILDERAQNTSR